MEKIGCAASARLSHIPSRSSMRLAAAAMAEARSSPPVDARGLASTISTGSSGALRAIARAAVRPAVPPPAMTISGWSELSIGAASVA
jgi:hypothetical protein